MKTLALLATCLATAAQAAPVTLAVTLPNAPGKLRVIEIQTSSNLKDWSLDGYYVVRQPQTTGPQFLRTISKLTP